MAVEVTPWAPMFVPEELNDESLSILLPAFMKLNELYLERHPETPLLYEAGVRYEEEPIGAELWLTIPWILKRKITCPKRGGGCTIDCEDLSAWRAAELRVVYGEPAQIAWSWQPVKNKGDRLCHIVVMRGDGSIEDPSARLGMNST